MSTLFEPLKGHRLYLESQSQFKTNALVLTYLQPLKEPETSLAALTMAMMSKFTGSLGPMDWQQRLGNLYGTVVSADTFKLSGALALQLRVIFPNDRHLPENILSQVLEACFDMFKSPFYENAGYDHLFEIERRSAIQGIKSKLDDPGYFGYTAFIKGLFKDDRYAIDRHGSINVLEHLSPKDCADYFERVILNQPLTLMFSGNCDTDQVKSLIDTHLHQVGKTHFALDSHPVFSVQEDQTLEKDLHQSKLFMAFAPYKQLDLSEYFALVVANQHFGGGAGSLLFESLRENLHLCYSIGAKVDRYTPYILVTSGVSASKLGQAKSAIYDHFNNYVANGLDGVALQTAQNQCISQIKALNDTQVGRMNYLMIQAIRSHPQALDQVVAMIKMVDANQIKAVLSTLNPVFTLELKEAAHAKVI